MTKTTTREEWRQDLRGEWAIAVTTVPVIEMTCDSCEEVTEFSLWTSWTAENGNDLYECWACGRKQDPLAVDPHEGDPDWGYPD